MNKNLSKMNRKLYMLILKRFFFWTGITLIIMAAPSLFAA
jgi:hypothetical protein